MTIMKLGSQVIVTCFSYALPTWHHLGTKEGKPMQMKSAKQLHLIVQITNQGVYECSGKTSSGHKFIAQFILMVLGKNFSIKAYCILPIICQ